MPEKSGLDTIIEIIAKDSWVKIVAISSVVRQEDVIGGILEATASKG